jgi:peptidoglycan hydrolase-like protein with peptidoglycan-binding domain
MSSTRSSLRRIATTVVTGLTLSLVPLPLGSLTVVAAPASAVTGLARGARGDAVREVQQALVNQGISVAGGIDGIYGPGTEAAVIQFQSRSGLTQSGSVDLATAIALGLESSSTLGLTQGASGPDVVSLQQQLEAAGHRPNGGADGIFGPATDAALKAFQAAKGLPQTGTVDAGTAAALASAGGSTQPSPAPVATPDPGNGSLNGLKIGSRGDAVKRLQQALMDLGFTVVGGADGIYGALTANAVKSFQNANGLGTSGAVDEATAAALAASAGSGGSSQEHDPSVSSPFVGLQYGSLGSDVQGLQQALIDAGIQLRGGADGVYGQVTVAAVKQFQGNHGLEQTGKVDQATANALASRDPGSTATASILGLKAGALGNTVKQLQQSLIDAGVTVRGGADGIFGPATASALKSFQTSQGLPATGEVDQATADALANPQAPVSGSSSGSTDGFAAYGEKGSRVSALQQRLVDAGIALRGGVDGDFGSGTSAAVMEFQRQRGLPVTGKVDASTASALGLTAAPAPTAPDPASVQMQVFPVQGKCYFGDSFGYPRSGGRTHLGTDIIAPVGNLLYAAVDGKISKVYHDYPGSLAGNAVRVSKPDGTYFFYAHMTEFGPGIELGVPVTAGQVVGTVGDTGNAGTAHLHIEVHPQGGAAVNPYPLLKAIDACNVTTPLGQ